MTDNSKFATMIRFAKRARKIVYGYDALADARGLKVLAVSDTASDNLKDKMQGLAKKRGLPLIRATALEDTAGGNCKALGVTDVGMAREMVRTAKDSDITEVTYIG